MPRPKRTSSREQRTTVVNGILSFVMLIVVLQLWLLTATMDAFLGGDDGVVIPALLASAAGLAANLGLLRMMAKKKL